MKSIPKNQSGKTTSRLRDLQPKADPKGGKATVHDIPITKPIDKSSP